MPPSPFQTIYDWRRWQVNCNSPGRYNVVSYGRRRRSLDANQTDDNNALNDEEPLNDDDGTDLNETTTQTNITFESDPEQVRELLQVYLTRADIPVSQPGESSFG